ncbi:pyridoxal kinase PdxY [Mesorhizobium sp. RP14(2022)]|uniref:pyridoxal kinase n=1 Tax=Mesorhizobium liriopis TaxID=2953882 RepID=A0ABT1C958_9HYPH|nr:pyridoxal kinase PdxY [Mesorhizobium liriopis]
MSERTDQPRAVIVASSHVVRGSLGNRAVVFAFETLGFTVWALPTVTLPWHEGRREATRIVPAPGDWEKLVDDLIAAPWLGEIGAVLTGFLGSAEQAVQLSRLVRAVKEKNHRATYLCDPVLGDDGEIYVEEAIAEAIRDHLLPLADIATPNRTELEWLAGAPVPDIEHTIAAALDLGPRMVLTTSAPVAHEGSTGNLLLTPTEVLLAEHRRISSAPHGTGDLTAALFLARLSEGMAPAKALQATTASVFDLVARTASREADELTLATDRHSLVEPMGMVQLRKLAHPGGE